MNQRPHMGSDLTTLLLCCDDDGLATVARPLRRLRPDFGADPVIRHAGHRLSGCPVVIAVFIERVVDDLPSRPYGEGQADLAAAALVGAGKTLDSATTLAEIEASVLHALDGLAVRDDRQELAFAIATLRLPFVKRGKLLGLPVGNSHFSLKEEKVMSASNWTFDQIWKSIEANIGGIPIFNMAREKMKEEQEKLGKVRILVAGKTGFGKSTLINAVFGENVAATGAGRPVTSDIRWYEPAGRPVRLCDTKGLELADFQKILVDLEAEIKKGLSSGRVEDRIHVLWLCIAEPGARVEDGEMKLAALCEQYQVPAIVVLTKAIGPKSFKKTVKDVMPGVKAVVRVLVEEWDDEDGHRRPAFGLLDLISATGDLLPDITKAAFDAAQRVDIERKRRRAISAVWQAAALATAAAATPIPVADVAAVVSINIGMIVSVSSVMGVDMSWGNMKTNALPMIAAMAVSGGGRLLAGELLKFIPGVGSVAGGAITAAIAGSATYGLGYGYVEFLCRFQDDNHRMPGGDEIKDGFQKFWQGWGEKSKAPPKEIPSVANGPD